MEKKSNRSIRLLIDTVTIASPGILQLKYELISSAIRNMPEGAKIIILQDKKHDLFKASSDVTVENMAKPKGAWIGRWYWYNSKLPKMIKKYNINVFYSLSGILSTFICNKTGTIGTVNNMLPFTEEQIRHFPLFSMGRIRLYLLRRMYIKTAKMADALILHSHHALKSIAQWAGDIKRKSFVVLTGVPKMISNARKKKINHPYKGHSYMFTLSTIYWYKNYINLIKAYKLATLKDPAMPDLIIAGYPVDKEYVRQMEEEIRSSGLEKRVKFIGALDESKIPAWIQYADINLFPSLCETNSVVQSEILGLSGVMACSNIPPMTEVAGDAALFFDPYIPDSMAQAMIKLIGNKKLQKDLRKKASRRAEALSWDKCGQVIWKAAVLALKDQEIRRKKNGSKE
ncbi:MAG: glycosyltransferase family 4 protein [Spirochaetes bacterium]|nr:glycosyltransferase family 4 protein [Spirochaetota bacterium]